MAQRTRKRLKMLHVSSTCILIIGVLGIIFNLIVTPEKFPTISLYLAAIGAMLAVAISTKFLIWRNYEK